MATVPAHFKLNLQGAADPAAIVRAPNARFTVLTSRLIRLEYSPTEQFEDLPSQAFWYRRQPVPAFKETRQNNLLTIDTSELELTYSLRQPFSPASLAIRIKENGAVWHFGDADTGNLGGTSRTLDGAAGAIPLGSGLLSRQGWVLVDDSKSLVFNAESWLEARRAAPGALDLYFFGYGQAYQDCLADYRYLTGPAPLIPRWMLGNWWSRFWEYSQSELLELMHDFRRHQVPLSVCIVDMDWHITNTGNQSSGWTGYTWNKDLFPEPEKFIAELHSLGLKTALNLHPADGIHPHEAAYPKMAAALGVDPKSKQPLPFNIADPEFTRLYFELLHHPLEEQGVDFWWVDWQQGTLSALPGLDPLWWLNHLHYLDLGRDGSKRPVIFSRWGGLGNHRYPIGFSGDSVVGWQALAFQPHMTATAANVCYGWWSHDIGGHMQGLETAELYTRWVQYAVFSPILRLHSTKLPYHERRPWGYGAETLRITRSAFQLRHALIPYLYSMAYRDSRQGIPLVRPLYHTHADQPQAYCAPNQYWFGSELLAAPFVAPADPEIGLSRQVVWLPEGKWFNFFSGKPLPHGWQVIYGSLEEIPVFARAGAIVPLAPAPNWGGVANPDELEIHIFPGADNHFDLYEDDGETDRSAGALTRFVLSESGDHTDFTIQPASGDTQPLPARRGYRLVFHALAQPKASAKLNGQPVPLDWRYDSESKTLRSAPIQLTPADHLLVHLTPSRKSLQLPALDLTAHRFEQALLLLKAMHAEVGLKTSLHYELAQILAQPARLAAFRSALSDIQMRALLEVITGAGVDHHANTGEELLLVWNAAPDDKVRFSLTWENRRSWDFHRRFLLEDGSLPGFHCWRPAQDFVVHEPSAHAASPNPWSLILDYHGIYTQRLDFKAGPLDLR